MATDGTAEQLDRRDATTAAIAAELAAGNARIAELEAVVAKQAALLEELTEKLNRNSSNSHLPPSSDGPGSQTGRKKPNSKPKRKRGGQKGHRGAHRSLAPVVSENLIGGSSGLAVIEG